jgi:hypothetical protein
MDGRSPNLWDHGCARPQEDPMNDVTLPAPPPVLEPPPSRKRRRGVVGAAIVVALLVLGGAVLVLVDGEQAEAGPLALTFTPGETQRYRIDQTMDITLGGDLAVGVSGPLALETSQVVSWEVRDVDSDGVATIRVTAETPSGTVNGLPIPSMGSTPAVDISVSPSGRVVSVGGPALGGSSLDLAGGPFGKLLEMPGTDRFTPLLPPDGDAQPGDSWESSYAEDVPFGHGSVGIDATSRYDRDESVDGTDTAVIVTDSTLSMDVKLDVSEILGALGAAGLPSGPTGLPDLSGAALSYTGGGTFDQTSWLDLASQDVVKMHTTGDVDVTMWFDGFPGYAGTLTMTGTLDQELTRL